MSDSEGKPNVARPLVARAVNNRGLWAFAAIMIMGGGALFAALENHRTARETASVGDRNDPVDSSSSATPELAIPSGYQDAQPLNNVEQRAAGLERASAPFTPILRLAQAPYQPSIQPPITIRTPRPTQVSPYTGSATPSQAVDSGYDGDRPRPRGDAAGGTGKAGERVEAMHFLNPTTTVPKGTVIQAVLETAFDSTRAGFARAIVSRDIYGFDGRKILIPKGSRLIGEYKADLADGQSRALIQWSRLTRPDGVIIALDSPSADPLGRAGVKGKVHSHFFAKFGGAILQSALDVGSQVATNKIANGTVVYAVPALYGSAQNAAQSSTLSSANRVQPTLTIKQGSSVSVFVARDLDFTDVEE